MNTRYKIIIIAITSILISLQTATMVDCLAEEGGQPGLFSCTWVIPNFILPHAHAIGEPPPERVPVSMLRVMDIQGNTIDGLVNVDKQIQIQADLVNAQDTVQSLAYIVEVYDKNEVQVFRGWIEATLDPKTSFSPAVSWIPKKPGYYTAKMMVWEALDNSSALTPGMEAEFTVVGNMNALSENRRCAEDKEIVFKINYKKVACVYPETLVKLLGRGWANWHDWYSPLFIDNLREGPQDVDDVHAEFIKREIMRDSKVADYFVRAKKYDFTCCSYQYNENDRIPKYQLVINISDLPNEKQLVVVYDLQQTKVVESKLKDLINLGGGLPDLSDPNRFTEPEPKTKNIISVRDRIPERTIVPITITQMTTNAESLDEIAHWNFSLLGIEMESLGDYWGNLPNQYVENEMVDDNGNDVLDYSRIPDGMIFYKLSLLYYPAVCEDGQQIKGEGLLPEPIPIKKGSSSVFFKSGSVGLYPDNDGKYSLEFVSGFETEIEFHPNIEVISQETKKCDLENERGNFTDVYYTNAVFSLKVE